MDQAQFIGFPRLEETLTTQLVVLTSAGVPINADADPTYHIYRAGTRILSGNCSKNHSGTLTTSTGNGVSPIVVTTSSAHGLAVGQVVTISGVTGNTNVNGTKVITAVGSSTQFTFAGTGNGTYGGSGVWNTTGAYKAAPALTAANGFTTGGPYEIDFNYQLSGTDNAQSQKFWID